MCVLGSINADVLVRASELPVAGATVLGHMVEVLPGGKGLNQAVAAVRAGGVDVRLVGCIGDDEWGDRLDAFLTETGVDRRLVRRRPTSTGVAVVTVDDHGENSIVVVPGSNRDDAIRSAADEAMADVGPGDVVVAQLEIPADVVARALAQAAAAGAITMLNASPVSELAPGCLEHVALVVVNEHEAAALSLPQGRRPGQRVVMTLGASGADLVDDHGVTNFAARPADVVDTTGAGDCFTGVLAAGLAAGLPIEDGLRRATIAASLQVERVGAASAMPTSDEIDAVEVG